MVTRHTLGPFGNEKTAEVATMRVPLTVADFLARGETAFAASIAVIDDPDQPAPPVPTSTFRELGSRVRAWQAGLDALGVGPGQRVAVVSPDSTRLLELLHAVPASGRICVPVNFRLRAEEVDYIVSHSGASVLLVDPEVDDALKAVAAPHPSCDCHHGQEHWQQHLRRSRLPFLVKRGTGAAPQPSARSVAMVCPFRFLQLF
jgi:acyl-CoA synthetase (AMP-forming)/AMP-acid ligase II